MSEPTVPSGEEKVCKRCGKSFIHQPEQLTTRFCEMCECRNLMDGLGLPTPPSIVDPYSKHPTLSEREFQNELRKPD